MSVAASLGSVCSQAREMGSHSCDLPGTPKVSKCTPNLSLVWELEGSVSGALSKHT